MSILAKVRKDMMSSGLSEAEVLGEGVAIQALFDELQALKRERAQAKLEAMKKVDEDYTAAQESPEKRYAMMMKLSARTAEK